MAQFFTNENPGNDEKKGVINDSGTYGVISTSNDPLNTANIDDGLTERGAALGKLGSSMPSPVARLFLFTAALREVNHLEAEHSGQGHNGKINGQNGQLETTPYHDLVGELLDMLEFVFKYGDERDFHVATWNVTAECANLRASAGADGKPLPSHERLASALESAFSYGPLKNNPSVFLFKWGRDKDAKVIGGSSPISLVYTSPNLRSIIREKSYRFVGDAGNQLFTDTPWPLHKRAASFREYLYRLCLSYSLTGSYLDELVTYIQDSATHINYDGNATFMPEVRNTKKGDWTGTGFKELKSKGAAVKVAGIQLRVSDKTFDPSKSDYLMAPKTTVYQNGNANTKTPLVLTKQGVAGLIYACGRQWIMPTPGNPSGDVIPAVPDANINVRTLPGVDAPYPYLTVSDFFEDKIIEVSYNIDGARFFTGTDDQHPTQFLLPLKKTFFDYFRVQDLKNMLTMKVDEERKKVYVDLQVPLVRGKSIHLHKEYDISEKSDNRIDCYDGANTFDFAVFPFYRLDPDRNNRYNVMLGTSLDGVTMRFYEQGMVIPTAPALRTRKGAASQLSTYHIGIGGAFSYAELTIPQQEKSEVHALIVPIFDVIDSNPAASTRQFTFGIDFGTTNTFIAYADTPHGVPLGQDLLHPFTYGAADAQMVTFNSRESGAGEFSAFITATKREFVPDTIGDGRVKFPMRTASYEIAGRHNGLKMFESTNVGFNYGEDISKSSSYKTNIKWDLTNPYAADRIRAFFTELLWMMKNKSVVNGGSTNFDLVVTYPLAMRPNDYSNFTNAWVAATQDVRCGVNLRYRTESIAPYYSWSANLLYGQPYANIDIGGGTSDLLYVDPINNEAHVFSAFFAANDLWNDGLDPGNRAAKANGFVQLYQALKLPNIGDKRAEVEGVIRSALSSADIISYLFANDSWSHLSDLIRSTPQIMQLPIIHFSSIAFYMAYAIHMAEVEVPRTLTFTGMGSKYIQLISAAESDIAQIVNTVFHYCGRLFQNTVLQKAGINVKFNKANPKEVTANGALLSINYPNPIAPLEVIFFGYEGEDLSQTLQYQDITDNVEVAVMKLFDSFVEMLKDKTYTSVLGSLNFGIDGEIIAKLKEYARPSFLQMKQSSSYNQRPASPLREPMFFWPLKNSLYVIGKELAPDVIRESNNTQS